MIGNGFEYTRTYGAPAAQLRGEFFMDTERDTRASIEAGRDIFRELERVRILIPGMVASVVVKNVTDEHRQRWPQQYAAFRAGAEAPLTGTPLEEWPILNRAMVAELRHLQIRTVEELSQLSDIAVQHIGMGGRALRDRARAFLDDAEHEALVSRMTAENDQLRLRVSTLENQVNELSRLAATLDTRMRGSADAPHPMLSHIPGSDDPFERAKLAVGAPMAGPSALDALGDRPVRRRGPPPVVEGETAGDAAAAA